MNQHQKIKLIYRIMSGQYRISYCGQYYTIKEPSLKIQMQSYELYDRISYKYRFGTWLSNYECLQLTKWDVQSELAQKELVKNIENAKIDLYNSGFNSKEQKKIRKRLSMISKQYNNLIERKHKFDHSTLEGFALTLQHEFILLKTIFIKKQSLYSMRKQYSFSFLENLFYIVLQQRLSDEDYRELARSDEWREIWHTGKPNPFRTRLTDTQRKLVARSKFYDSIYKNDKCPSENVINDNDLLDGWILMMNRKSEQEKAQHRGDEIASKHKNASEVFVVAKSQEDIEQINKMNDMRGQVVKAQRQTKINQGHAVKDNEFFDTKLDLQEKSNQQFKNTIKGK